MPVSKHLSRNQHKKRSKVKVAPRSDANQGVREHIENVRKQNEYIARKIEEYRQKQEELRKAMEEQQQSTAGQMIDGRDESHIDLANE